MKGVIAFALLCLLACSGLSQGSEIKERSLSHLSRQVRQANVCSWECTGEGDNIVFQIEGNIYIIFNKTYNYFAYFNADLQIVIIFDINTGLIGIFNFKLGGSFIINIQKNIIIFISFDKQNTNTTAEILLAIEIAFKFIGTNKDKVTTNIDYSIAFNFNLFIQAILKGTLKVFLAANASLYAQINASFGIFFEAIVTAAGSAYVDIKCAYSVLLGGIFKITTNVNTTLITYFNIFVKVSTSKILQVVDIFNLIFTTIQKQTEASLKIVLKLLVAIQLGFVTNIEKAISDIKSGITAFLNSFTTIQIPLNGVVYNVAYYRVGANFVFQFSANGKATVNIIFNSVNATLTFINTSNGAIVLISLLQKAHINIYNGTHGVGLAIKYDILSGVKGCKLETDADLIAKAYFAGDYNLCIKLIYQNVVTASSKGVFDIDVAKFFKGQLAFSANFSIWISYNINVTGLSSLGGVISVFFVELGLGFGAAVGAAVITVISLPLITASLIVTISSAFYTAFTGIISVGFKGSFGFSIGGSISG